MAKILQKKFSLLLIALLIVGGFFVQNVQAQITEIYLGFPDGGEKWRGIRNITWSGVFDEPADTIGIFYAADGINYNQLVASNILFSNWLYSWNTSTFLETLSARIKIASNDLPPLDDSSTNVFIVDNTAPVTTYAIAPPTPNGSNGWYVSVPTITLSCADTGGSGCNKTWYKWDGAGSWIDNAVTPPTALEGQRILSFYSDDQATDASGARNIETVQTQTIKVDTIAPTVAVTSVTPNGAYNESDAINVTLTFSEAVSSSNTLTVTLDTGGTCSVPILASATTGICTYIVGAGQNSSDLTVTSIVPVSGVVEDIAGNDSTLSPTSNMAATSDIVIDTTAPAGFATGSATVTGGTVVATWWNSTNTGVDVVVPVANDASLTGGTIQLQAEADGSFENVGAPYTILVGDLNNNKTLSLTAAQLEAISGFSEGDTITFRAVITDLAGNPTTGANSANTETVDQIAPAVNAGTDQEVKAIVSQDATTSDGGSDIASYLWTGPATISFGTPATEDTTISAGVDGVYTITLTVTDNAGNVNSNTIQFAWDTTKPVLAQITAVSSPTNDTTPSYTFSADSVKQLPASANGTINFSGACGAGAPTSPLAGSNTITYTGLLADAVYSDCVITVTDAAGNTSSNLAVNTFEVDTIVAIVSSITTTDANLDGKVDTATIVFTDEVKDSTFSASNFTIGGILATTFSTGITANDNTIVLSHAGVAGTNAKTVAYIPGTATDLAGNTLAGFSQTSTDAAKPVLLSARTIDTTHVTATFSEDLDGDTVNGGGNEFTVAGYAVSAASETAPGVVTLTVATMPTNATPLVIYTSDGPFNDLAPAPNTAVTPKTVTAVDGVAPTLSAVSISSNNDGDLIAPEWAKVGDTATLTFTSSEPIVAPIVLLDGISATISGGTTSWTATYTFIGGETDGTIPISIAFEDLASPTHNIGTTVTATGDGSSVFFDEMNPVVDAGTDKEVNAVVLQNATVSDPAPSSGILSYLWTKTLGVGTITFGSATAKDTTISAGTDGTYTLRLTVIDNAGNSAFDEMTFIWDTTNPVAITSTPSDGTTGVSKSSGTATVQFTEKIKLTDSGKVLFVDSAGTSYKGAVAVNGGDGTSDILNINYSALNYGIKYRINVIPSPQESNSLSAVTDIAGNKLVTSWTSYFTTEIDTVPPVVNSLSAGSITTTGATLSVTTDESATCRYATTDSEYAAMTAFEAPNTGTSHTAVLTGLIPSTGYDYYVRCADTSAQTNTMTTSAHVSFTTVTAVVTPTVAVNGPTIVSAYSVTQANGRFASGLRFNTTDCASATVNGANVVCGSIFIAVSNADAETLGAHSYNVIVTSSTGHTASIMVTYQVNADDIVPVLPAVALVGDAILPQYTVLSADGRFVSDLKVNLTNAASVSVNGIVTNAPSSPFTVALNADLKTLGVHSYDIVVTSSTGHTASLNISFEVIVNTDTTAPPVPSITTDTAIVNSDSYQISGTAGADTPNPGVRTISVYNGLILAGTAVVPVGQTGWSVSVTLTQNFANSFTAISTDSSGNASTASTAVIITEDGTVGADVTPPNAPVISNSDNNVDADTYAISGTAADDGGTRIITVYRNSVPVAVGTTVLAAGETTWSVSVPLNQGTTNNFTARSIDEVGNESIVSNSVIITEETAADTTAPDITNIQATLITQTGATITWNTDELATSRVEYGLTSSYGNFTNIDGTADNMSHSVALAGLTAGTEYHFRALSTDAIGNAGTSVDGTFTTSAPTPDTIAPPVPSITTGTATVNSDSYLISGTAGADTPSDTVRTIQVYNDVILAGTAVVPVGQTGWAVIVMLNQNTTNSFTAISTDSSGNSSAASSAVVITEDGTVGTDTTPPYDPELTIVDDTVDANVYEVTGTVADDGGVRTISVYNDTTVVGTVVLPAGSKDWAVTVSLLQDAENNFTAYATDEAGNTSDVSDEVIITEETVVDATPPVITLLGANPLTLTVGDTFTDPGATANDNIDGDITGDIDVVNTVNTNIAGTYTVTYDVDDAASNNAIQETRTVIVRAAFDDTATLKVTGIDAVANANGSTGFAMANDNFGDGWAWIFHVTVPTDETLFAMKFSDFVSGLNNIPAAANIRFYSAQSSDASTAGSAITISAANTYSANMTLASDILSGTAGRQIDVRVEVKVPIGTAGGSYSTSYGVQSLPPII